MARNMSEGLLMKLIQVLKELGIRYDAGNNYLLVERNALIIAYPSNEIPEVRGGSYELARRDLNRRVGGRIWWGKIDDDWFAVDRIIPESS